MGAFPSPTEKQYLPVGLGAYHTLTSYLPAPCPAGVSGGGLTLCKLGCGTNDDPLHGLLHGILPHAPLQHVDELHSHSRGTLRNGSGVRWALVMHLLVSVCMLWCCWHWQLALEQVYRDDGFLATVRPDLEEG